MGKCTFYDDNSSENPSYLPQGQGEMPSRDPIPLILTAEMYWCILWLQILFNRTNFRPQTKILPGWFDAKQQYNYTALEISSFLYSSDKIDI